MQCKEFTDITGSVVYTSDDLGWDPSAYTNHAIIVDADDSSAVYLSLRLKGGSLYGMPTMAKLTDPNAYQSHFAVSAADGIVDRFALSWSGDPTSASVVIQSFNLSGDARL